MASVFVDHGPEFTIKDPDGKEPLVKIITDVELRNETVTLPNGESVVHQYTLIRYITPEGQQPGSLRDNSLITISDVEGVHATTEEAARAFGANSINTGGPYRTYRRETDPVNSVRIRKLIGFSQYVGGGILTESKEPHTVKFRSLAECIIRPATTATGVIANTGEQGFVMTDMMSQFSAGGVEQQIHVALQGVFAFQVWIIYIYVYVY